VPAIGSGCHATPTCPSIFAPGRVACDAVGCDRWTFGIDSPRLAPGNWTAAAGASVLHPVARGLHRLSQSVRREIRQLCRRLTRTSSTGRMRMACTDGESLAADDCWGVAALDTDAWCGWQAILTNPRCMPWKHQLSLSTGVTLTQKWLSTSTTLRRIVPCTQHRPLHPQLCSGRHQLIQSPHLRVLVSRQPAATGLSAATGTAIHIQLLRPVGG
jgi:hypothetical protein